MSFYYRLSFCIPNTQKDAPTPEKELLFIFSPLCSFSLSFHLKPISSLTVLQHFVIAGKEKFRATFDNQLFARPNVSPSFHVRMWWDPHFTTCMIVANKIRKYMMGSLYIFISQSIYVLHFKYFCPIFLAYTSLNSVI